MARPFGQHGTLGFRAFGAGARFYLWFVGKY